VKSIFIENETFVNCKSKHLPIMQSMKSNGLSRIKFSDTSQLLGPSFTASKIILKIPKAIS